MCFGHHPCCGLQSFWGNFHWKHSKAHDKHMAGYDKHMAGNDRNSLLKERRMTFVMGPAPHLSPRMAFPNRLKGGHRWILGRPTKRETNIGRSFRDHVKTGLRLTPEFPQVAPEPININKTIKNEVHQIINAQYIDIHKCIHE